MWQTGPPILCWCSWQKSTVVIGHTRLIFCSWSNIFRPYKVTSRLLVSQWILGILYILLSSKLYFLLASDSSNSQRQNGWKTKIYRSRIEGNLYFWYLHASDIFSNQFLLIVKEIICNQFCSESNDSTEKLKILSVVLYHIQACFDEMDMDKNGWISKKEMFGCYKKLGCSDAEAAELAQVE